MQFSVTFRHMDATDALKGYAKDRLEKIRKYFPDPIMIHVVMSTERVFSAGDRAMHAASPETGGTPSASERRALTLLESCMMCCSAATHGNKPALTFLRQQIVLAIG